MSSDSEPVIQTVGSADRPDTAVDPVDRRDQAELSDKVRGSVDEVPLGVLHDKLDDVKNNGKEKVRGPAAGAHDGASGPLASGGPGVVGEIRTVGSAEPSDGSGAAADGRGETRHGGG